MSDKVTTHVHTNETPATQPARLLALQTVADLSDRKLAHFHWREASELLGDIEHKVRDYDQEDTNFQPHEAEEIEEKVVRIAIRLGHVRTIANESAERTRAEIARLAAETTTKEGGAK